MNHEALREQLVDLALGLLAPGQAREVEAHAAGCPECAAALAGLRQTRAAVGGLPPLPAPERGEAILLAAARQAASRRQASRPRLLPGWLWGAAVGAATAAAVALVTFRLSTSSPPSRFDEGRDALLGQPTVVAAAPEPPAAPSVAGASAQAPAPSQAPALEPRRRAAADDQGARRQVSPPPAEQHARVEAIQVAREEAAPQLGPPSSGGSRGAIGIGGADMASSSAAAVRPAQADLAKAEVALDASQPAAASAPAPAAPAALAAPAARAKAAAEAKVAAPRPPPAPAAMTTQGPPPDPARAERRAFPGCPAERERTFTRDAAGRLLGRQRAGTLGGVDYRAEERYADDGRLEGAHLRLGERELTLDAAALARVGLEPFPGLRLAPSAAAALAEPPACGP